MSDLPFGSAADPDASPTRRCSASCSASWRPRPGPVNWELARQIGIANALEGRDDPEPTGRRPQEFEEAVRVAELHVARFTGLEAPDRRRRGQGRPPRRVGERQHREPARAARARRAEDRRGDGRGDPRGARGRAAARDAGHRRDAGAALAAAAGRPGRAACSASSASTCSVSTTSRSRARGPGACCSSCRTSRRSRSDWSLDPTDFRTCVALHEVTHRFEFARPWARERFAELLDDFLSTLKIDVDGMQARLSLARRGRPRGAAGR